MISHPWAIVCTSPSNKAVATDEVNDRTSLGDRSQKPLNCSTPSEEVNDHTSLGNRTHSGEVSHVTYLGHCFPFPPSFPLFPPSLLQQFVALDCFLVGVSTSFSGHVFLDTSLGV
jgi:hypothetical protein